MVAGILNPGVWAWGNLTSKLAAELLPAHVLILAKCVPNRQKARRKIAGGRSICT